MNQPISNLSLNGSRLIRLLSELANPGVEHSFDDFGGRIGQLFALKDSLKLAEMHSDLSRVDFDQRPMDKEAIQAFFLDSRKSIVDAIGSRFVPVDDQRINRVQFPSLRANASAEQLSSYDSYQGFYINQQRQMDREVQHLLSYLRDAAAGLSPRLAQLVEIDTTVGEGLASQARGLFALVPALLGKRFEFLRQQHHQALFNPAQDDVALWLKPGAWLDRFRIDTYELLLAELDVRLQPALGLLEAIDEE